MNVLKKLKNSIKRNFLCRSKGIALMYHRVMDLPLDPWKLCVSPKNFEEQMRILKKYCIPVQMQEMCKTIHNYSVGRKQVTVTFDDGYEDNYTNAKPILEHYKIPATFFIVTGMVEQAQEFWWDELERTIFQTKELPAEFKMTINNADYSWGIDPVIIKDAPTCMQSDIPIPNDSIITRNQLYLLLWNILSHLSFEEKRKVLSKISLWAGPAIPPRSSHNIMTKEELLNLSRVKFFEIGAHTQNHPMLAYLNIKDQRNEIKESKLYLEGIIGRPVESFSYPHGSYTAETVSLVQELGFKASCTVKAKPATREDSPFLLPRFGVFNWDGPTFEKKLREWMGIY